MPKVEMKSLWYHHNEVALNTLNQGYNAYGPNIIQGTQSWNRIGNKVNLGGLHIKGIIKNNATTENYVRMLVIGYDGVRGTSILNELFRADQVGATGAMSTINGLDAIYFPLNKVDIKVYRDKVMKLGGDGAGTAGSNTRMFSEFIKFNGRKIEYKGALTGVGNQNWIYSILFIAAEASDDTTTGQVVEMSMLERLYFKDS